MGAVEQGIDSQLENCLTSENALVYMHADIVQKRVNLQMKMIRRFYKRLVLHGEKGAAEQFLLEHYYLIEREGKALLQDNSNILLPFGSSSISPDIIQAIKICMKSSDFLFSTEAILKMIALVEKKRKLKNFELEFIPSAIKASAIELVWEEIQRESWRPEIFQRAIDALFRVKNLNITVLIQESNHLEILLKQDASGEYADMTEKTRSIYRYKLSMTAIRRQIDELRLAEQYLTECQKDRKHIGFPIYQEYHKLFGKKLLPKLYIPFLFSISFLFSALLSLWSGQILLFPLLYFPVWAVLKPMVDYFFMFSIKSEAMPRMELKGEIPPKGRTLITVATLLPNPKELEKLKKKLTKLYMTNCSGDVRIILLADLKESRLPVSDEDERMLCLTQNMIRKLNKSYQNHFMLLVRKRSYSKTQQIFTGKERKRGAIDTLIRMIMGEQPAWEELEAFEGDQKYLEKVKYLYVLDYDTKALMETAEQLVSVALHPLNQPKVEKNGIVTEGYGIFAPKVGVDLKDSLKTPFAKIMGGLGGISAYDKSGGDLYQDLYGEGIFAGKGLINVSLFSELLANRFPEETVLSHDILEGGFLRTAYVSDVELLDSFPQSVGSYYKRLHRWIRGDYQNLPYLFSTVKTMQGKSKNSLNYLSRFKLFDNLRRELTAVFALGCILLALFMPAKAAGILTACGILAVISPFLFGLFMTLFSGGFFSLSKKYYSKTLPQTFELLSQALYEMVLLPRQAVNNLDAIVRALYRRFVSHKKLMEWTTAAQAEKSGKSISNIFLSSWYSVPLGIFMILWTQGILRIAGFLFLAMIPLTIYCERKYKREKRSPSAEENDQLLTTLSAMWGFYQDFTNEKENWLPPDNIQEAPVFQIAHRTSPTNIGMMLLSTLAARDADLIDTVTLVHRIDNTISTLEKMKKFHGNLYNWYDTKTLEVLEPQYVSTVDSGNFVCCLTALKEGLKEYRGEDERIIKLIDRVENIKKETDLSIFFDHNKKLFSIGYDSKEKRLSSSSYDMLMSEARMTGYYAIAMRQVPLEHWGALGRTLARSNFYTGPISWTGTMFEYFMPELLLRCVNGSLGYEGLRFCLYCQKRRARQKKIPFGISESGYYAFDAKLNYQYQAFGIQKLALKKDQDRNTVVSPYSSFLTLPFDFEASFQNLNWLKQIGMYGKYGFYEAIDFTQGRVRNKGYQIIKSYMAHHVGMSILATANVLNDNIMQKRFLRDPDMNRANELLQEKVIAGGTVYRDVERRENGRKNIRETDMGLEYQNLYPHNPRVHLLSNGEITSVLTDCGGSFLQYQSQDITRRSSDLLRRPQGFFGYVKSGNQTLPFSYAPDYDRQFEYRVKFDPDSVSYITANKNLQAGMKIRLHSSEPCEQRQLVVYNSSQQKRDAEFMVYLEPVLASFREDAAHPAFSKLFLQIRYDKVSNTLLAFRRKRGNQKPFFLAVGFLEEVAFEYESSREKLLRHPDGVFSLADSFEKRWSNTGNGTPDPCIAIKWKAVLPAKGQSEYTIILSVGHSESEAINGIVKLRSEGKIDQKNSGQILQHDSVEGRIAATVLPCILYRKPDSKLILKSLQQIQENKKSLWRYGISGDLPIVLLELSGENDIERVKNHIACHKILNMCHISYDLVFSYQEAQDYQQPILQMIREQTELLGQGGMLDSHGGIHAVNLHGNLQNEILFRAAACHIAPKSMVRIGKISEEYIPVSVLPVRQEKAEIKESYEFQNRSFVIYHHPHLPWNHILSNPAFGTLLSDESLGYTWAINARENKLTPWSNDPLSDNQGEQLLLKIGKHFYNLVKGAEVRFSPEGAQYHGNAEAIKTTVFVTVLPQGMAKNITLILENQTDQTVDIECAYYIEPVLGVDENNMKSVSSSFYKNTLFFENRFEQSFPTYMGLQSSETSHPVCNRADFWSGRWENITNLPHPDPCGALIVKKELPPKRKEKISFVLGFSMSEKGLPPVLQIGQNPAAQNQKQKNQITVCTPDEELNHFINTWLPHQILSSRVYGRTAFYQCGGAWGYRDQLQDVANLIVLEPQVAKRHILRAAASQFAEGDVLHWWHNLPEKNGKKGVRTRYSDDLLWLVYAVCEYIEKTGDRNILDIPIDYSQTPLLSDGEQERYDTVAAARQPEALYYHCVRALKKAYQLGKHELVLMGCGDWNDGYNQVGTEGKGESVWLTQFLAYLMNRFAPLTKERGEEKYALELQENADDLMRAVDQNAWDGRWYLRAYFDDGSKMGSHESEECQIDSLPQSFAVISEMPEKERIATAMNSAYERLVDKENHLIQLFAPAYQHSLQDPGYVKAYPTGIRENGGQYTHGAVWFALASLMMGDAERGYELLRILNPAIRYKEGKEKGYELEPYYIAADIYTNPSAYGHGGWSIYTGAAGWYYKTVVEHLLGICLRGDRLELRPILPDIWNGYSATLKFNNTEITLTVQKTGSKELLDNGVSAKWIALDGQKHTVLLRY